MKKRCMVLCVLLVLLLLVGCAAGPVAQPTPSPVLTPTPQPELTPEVEPEPLPEVVEDPLVWIVEPTLEYDHIYFCGECDIFSTGQHSGQVIDRRTGLLTGEENPGWGHGWPGGMLFDPEQGLIGFDDYSPGIHMWPVEEFFELFPMFLEALMAVERVDASLRETHPWGEAFAPGAFQGAYAVMHGRNLVTDFVFDETEEGWRVFGTIAMRVGAYWGFVDRHGEVVVPFVFGHVIHIDERTAFAEYDGGYGILDIGASVRGG